MPTSHPKRSVPWLPIGIALLLAIAMFMAFVVYTFKAQEKNGGPFIEEPRPQRTE